MDESTINRIENDALGSREIPRDAYYGIHTKRAIENFAINDKTTNIHLIHAITIVKKAAAIANQKLELIPYEIGSAIIEACDEILEGNFNTSFLVNAYQGGAGTSTNMNVNEVIANRSEEILGGKLGHYEIVQPLTHVNCCQSTNDVYPTALRIALIKLLKPLQDAMAELQTGLQIKENEFSEVLRLGRTQLMDALPMTVGQGFGAYAKAIARDRWRIYKVEERLRHINMGGTAIALVHHIGYDASALIAKKALKDSKTIKDVVLEQGLFTEDQINVILNVYQITTPGIPGK